MERDRGVEDPPSEFCRMFAPMYLLMPEGQSSGNHASYKKSTNLQSLTNLHASKYPEYCLSALYLFLSATHGEQRLLSTRPIGRTAA